MKRSRADRLTVAVVVLASAAVASAPAAVADEAVSALGLPTVDVMVAAEGGSDDGDGLASLLLRRLSSSLDSSCEPKASYHYFAKSMQDAGPAWVVTVGGLRKMGNSYIHVNIVSLKFCELANKGCTWLCLPESASLLTCSEYDVIKPYETNVQVGIWAVFIDPRTFFTHRFEPPDSSPYFPKS